MCRNNDDCKWMDARLYCQDYEMDFQPSVSTAYPEEIGVLPTLSQKHVPNTPTKFVRFIVLFTVVRYILHAKQYLNKVRSL